MPLVPQMMPDQYTGTVAPSSTSTQNAIAFGFNATRIVFRNNRAAAVYTRFSTTPSTDGFRTCAGETFDLAVPQCGGIAFASTTTSTGTFVDVLALG